MKILNSRKKVIAALSLSAIALTGCTKVHTVENNGRLYNIEDNSLLKDYGEELSLNERLTFDSTGLSILIQPSMDNNHLIISYDNNSQANEDVYEYLNNAINDMTENDSLDIYLSKGNLDFSKIDISKLKDIRFHVADVDFDYTPFYNNTYTSFSIDISGKTNIDSVVDFLENVKTENASISINFEDNTSVEDSQRVIDALAKIESVYSIDLLSSNINELNVVDLACQTLTLYNPTTNKKINYDFTVNDAVETLRVESLFAEEFEGESYLESFKIHSNNEKLWTKYLIYRRGDLNGFNINADDQSVFDLPDNTALDISGLDISGASNEWLRKFSNLNRISIKPYPANESTFTYDSDDMTIDEAIAEKDYKETKERTDRELEEIGIRYHTSYYGNIIVSSYNNTLEKVPDELYTILNRDFEDPSKYCLEIRNLNDQFDFSKVDLSNITRASFELTGPNFDFTPFYNQNISYLSLTIGENANHERILELLRNIPDNSMTIRIDFLEIEECQNPELQQLYIDTLSTKENLEEVIIDSSIANRLNYENLITDNLELFIKSDQDEINYDIRINDRVQYFSIITSYDEEYSKEVYIGNIKVNSNNNSLITILSFSNYSIDNYFNVNLDSDLTKITVPNGAGLKLRGVNFDDIDYEVIESLEYLGYLYITEDGNNDYVFYYYYIDNTFDEALNAFKEKNKNRKGASLTID